MVQPKYRIKNHGNLMNNDSDSVIVGLFFQLHHFLLIKLQNFSVTNNKNRFEMKHVTR